MCVGYMLIAGQCYVGSHCVLWGNWGRSEFFAGARNEVNDMLPIASADMLQDPIIFNHLNRAPPKQVVLDRSRGRR